MTSMREVLHEQLYIEDLYHLDDVIVQLKALGYYEAFEQFGNNVTRTCWVNDNPNPKLPVRAESRRIVLAYPQPLFYGIAPTLIVRGAPLAGPPRWVVLASVEVRTLEEFVAVLALPSVGVLDTSWTPMYRKLMTSTPCGDLGSLEGSVVRV